MNDNLHYGYIYKTVIHNDNSELNNYYYIGKKECSEKIKNNVTDSTRDKLSKSALGRHYYNNGLLQIYVKEPPDETWVEGKLYDKIPEDWKYYNNGLITVKAPYCPEGFKYGRITDSVEYRRKRKCQ